MTRSRALIALFSLVLPLACTPRGGAPATSAPLPAGDHPLAGAPAPSFSLNAPGGEVVGLEQYAGRVVLLDFWATWCEPCKQSFPRYQELFERHAGRVVVLGISEDEEAIGIDGFRAETGVTFPLVWDGDKAVAEQYRIKGMPTLFVIDQNGLVRAVHSGFRAGDEQRVAATVESLL